MKITISCPSCEQKVKILADRDEVQVKCPNCKLKWLWDEDFEKKDASKMGTLFKKVKNAMTGGSAKLHFEIQGEATVGGSVTVLTHIKTGDFPIESSGIYFQLCALEKINLPWSKVLTVRELTNKHRYHQLELLFRGSHFDHEEVTYKQTWTLEGATVLEANKEYVFTHTLDFPEGSKPTFIGKYIGYQWMINAYIDVFSKNPRTGWRTLYLSQS